MRRARLHHPLWVHLPAVLAIVGTAAYLILLPGGPDQETSPPLVPWLGSEETPARLLIFLASGLWIVVLSVLVDESWARQESRKRYNCLSLMDEVGVGVFAGYVWACLLWPGEPASAWAYLLSAQLAGIAALTGPAALLEVARRHHPFTRDGVPDGAEASAERLAAALRSRSRWAYWQFQDLLWLKAFFLPGAPASC